jgi:antitoxin VapB
MALNIKHAEADTLARKLAEVTGQSITEAVLHALREQLQRETGRRAAGRLKDELRAISQRCSQLPDRDTRSPEEIIGFDKHGLPKRRKW